MAHRAYRVFQRVRGPQTFGESSDIMTRNAEYEWLTTHRNANGPNNVPFVTWPGRTLKHTCGNGAYRTRLGQHWRGINTCSCQLALMLVSCGCGACVGVSMLQCCCAFVRAVSADAVSTKEVPLFCTTSFGSSSEKYTAPRCSRKEPKHCNF